MRQNQCTCSFRPDESWVILSPIEQSIKRKIEAAGKPLKEWGVSIYRGVLTGCNEAFIITSEKRAEILDHCRSKEERTRTEELIRPILRGRDIKRYGYTWADLWLINTHNGIKGKLSRVKIEEYPALKAHLDQYWGKISTRADRGETPYNLRNCAYMEDFSKPKIVWAELARTGNAFNIDFNYYMVGNTGYILTTNTNNVDILMYLLAFLNSRYILYSLNQISTRLDETGWRWLRQFVEQLRIPNLVQMEKIISLVKSMNSKNKLNLEKEINDVIYKILGFSTEERNYIDDCLTGF